MDANHLPEKLCRHCPRTFRRPGVTCGNSFCQEAEHNANRERVALARRRRRS